MTREPQATAICMAFRAGCKPLFFNNSSMQDAGKTPAGLAHGSGLAQACLTPQSKQSVMSAEHRPASGQGAD
jgi:hypothetical protein